MKRQSAFTVLEILIATAILALLTAIALPVGLDSYRSYVISSETKNIVALLRRAQSLAIANGHEGNWGMAFQSGQHVLFQGDSYASRNSALDEVYTEPPILAVTSAGDIIFASVSGAAQSTATVALSNGVRTHNVTVNTHGTISW